MTTKFAATLLTAAALAAIPTAIAPVAQAEVRGEVGRYVTVGGCTDVARDIAAPIVAGAAVFGADERGRYGFRRSHA
mgnify:CR=1 FL=1